MARRRHKFDVGDFVQVIRDNKPIGEIAKISMKMYDETNDTFNYRLEGIGWIEEKKLILITPFKPIIPTQTQESQ